MNAYEMTFIVRPDLDEEQARAAIDQVSGRIGTAGGEVVATVPWNPPRRRMAYQIRDFGDGFYVTTVFRIDSKALRPIESALRLNENILRFLLVQATDRNIQEAQQRLQQQTAPPRPAPRPETDAQDRPQAETAVPAETAAPAEEPAVPEPIAVAAESPASEPTAAAAVSEAPTSEAPTSESEAPASESEE